MGAAGKALTMLSMQVKFWEHHCQSRSVLEKVLRGSSSIARFWLSDLRLRVGSLSYKLSKSISRLLREWQVTFALKTPVATSKNSTAQHQGRKMYLVSGLRSECVLQLSFLRRALIQPYDLSTYQRKKKRHSYRKIMRRGWMCENCSLLGPFFKLSSIPERCVSNYSLWCCRVRGLLLNCK